MAFNKTCPRCGDPFQSRERKQICCSLSCAGQIKRAAQIKNNTRCVSWRVNVDTGCWESIGRYISKKGRGYPQIASGGRASMNLHRYLYEILFGEIPPGVIIRHTCDNKLCINPEHWLPGTVADNARDARERDRYTKGEQVHLAKLTEKRVRYILRHPQTSAKRLAAKFGISTSNIYSVWSRKTWRHVDAA